MRFGFSHTGASDEDWGSKFFQPYEPLLASIPFFPALGNHDGNETERHRDLAAILDNFAFPQNKPGRYYDFTYGGLAQFFALDSTSNTESGPARAGYLENSPQFHWMQSEFAKPHPLWVIPYFHHPMFTAGPDHPPSLEQLRHWFALFTNSGVKVVFSGHEHNFQASEVSPATGGIRFFVSGAGGELRRGNVQKNMPDRAHSGLGRTESLSRSRHRRKNDEGDAAFLRAAEHRGQRRRSGSHALSPSRSLKTSPREPPGIRL